MANWRVRIVFEFKTKMQSAEIRCRGCGRLVIYPPALAVERLGATNTLSELERRLRCRDCGARGASVRGVYREYHG